MRKDCNLGINSDCICINFLTELASLVAYSEISIKPAYVNGYGSFCGPAYLGNNITIQCVYSSFLNI